MLSSVAAAFALDLIAGDPVFRFHPVRLVGGMLARLEKAFYPMRRKTAAGVLLVVSATAAVFLVAAGVLAAGVLAAGVFTAGVLADGAAFTGGLRAMLFGLNPLFVAPVFFLFCNRDMIREARSVHDRLVEGDVPGARIRLARIVGRDTSRLDRRGIVRAAVETVAENLVDGFTSPFLYLLLGGIPLAWVFKTVSTIDSMFGYRDERYEKFGKAGARLDDVLNFVPARVNVLFMFFASGFSVRLLRAAVRFGGAHPSPNSGIAEAAFAGYLGVALGGPSVYGGVEKEKPWLGEDRLPPRGLEDPGLILRANRLYMGTVLLTFAAGSAALGFGLLPLVFGLF